jgi:hypothetical protein
MYTDRVDAKHVNFCLAPWGQRSAYFGPNARFGLQGSISTRDDCEQAGGTFLPHVLGWMVHLYPYEADDGKRWSIDDDAQGHDDMDRSAMPGMNMEPGSGAAMQPFSGWRVEAGDTASRRGD